MKIVYKAGYKYQLFRSYWGDVSIYPDEDIRTAWVELYTTGALHIKRGYAWDGPSGPTVDTKSFMRGSLVHDALYQLIREGYLPRSYRKQVDKELYRICREDGMALFRAAYVYAAVRLFARRAVMMKKEIVEAP